jgi:hypothetical protein
VACANSSLRTATGCDWHSVTIRGAARKRPMLPTRGQRAQSYECRDNFAADIVVLDHLWKGPQAANDGGARHSIREG